MSICWRRQAPDLCGGGGQKTTITMVTHPH
jgi:hypothetical protein